MSFQGIANFVQHYLATESIWIHHPGIIPKNTCIIAKEFNSDDIIFKIGDGSRRYKDLPIFLRFSRIEAAYYVNTITFVFPNDLNKILGIDEDSHIVATDIDKDWLVDLLYMVENLDIKGNIVIPQIISTDTTKIGSSIQLSVRAYDILQQHQVPIQEANWKIGDDSFSGLTIEYTVPNDRNLIGSELSIEVEVIDKYNKSSRKGRKNIEITENIIGGYVKNDFVCCGVSLIDFPIILSVDWGEDQHVSNHSYDITIVGYDPNGLDLTYELECLNSDVSITTISDNQFRVSYPTFTDTDTIVFFEIKITNTDGKEDILSVEKIVWDSYPRYYPPTIRTIFWDKDVQYIDNCYRLIIGCIDIQGFDLTFDIIPSIPSITITQVDDNIFDVCYPHFTEDTEVTLDITVTNDHGLSDHDVVSKTVSYVTPPIIDSIEWDQTIQFEQREYIVIINAHDEYNLNLSYQVSCDNSDVEINQYGIDNTFIVTYPPLASDTNITFTFTVTNDANMSASYDEVMTVKKFGPPVMVSYQWDYYDQWELNSYKLFADIIDPQNTKFTATISSDHDVSINLIGSWPYIWGITYPDYSEDTDITFTITMSNELGYESVETITTTVKAHLPPDVPTYSWNEDDQWEDGLYILTAECIDPHDLNIFYTLECLNNDDVKIDHYSSPNNQFAIEYPDIESDTTFEFKLTAMNSDNLSNEVTFSQDVKALLPPNIDDVFFNYIPNFSIRNTPEYFTENGEYYLCMSCSDPHSLDIVTNVSCDDFTVSIELVSENNGDFIYKITFGSYTEDTDITFTITATNEKDQETSVNMLVTVWSDIGNYAVFNGGFPINYGMSNPLSSLERIVISTPGQVIDFGELDTPRGDMGATSNGSNGKALVGCGNIDISLIPTTTIESYMIATPSSGTFFRNLVDRLSYTTMTSNGKNNDAIFIGGKKYIGNGSGINYVGNVSTMYYISITNPGSSIVYDNFIESNYNLVSTSNGVGNIGFVVGVGEDRKHTGYFTFNSVGSSDSFGEIYSGSGSRSLLSNRTGNRVVIWESTGVLEYVTITTPGNSIVTGNDPTYHPYTNSSGASNGTKNIGVVAGGYPGNDVSATTDVISYLNINTPSAVSNFGNLITPRSRNEASMDS